MFDYYCSTKIKRLVSVTSKILGYNDNKSKTSIGKRWLYAVLCLLFIFPASSGHVFASSEKIRINEGSYLLDRVIEWSDGSTEHIQIGEDGFFCIDGVKRKLIGMDLGSDFLPYGEREQFYLPENLAIYDKELTYLETVGVRVIYVMLPYIASHESQLEIDLEQERYRALMDLLYQHRMLAIPRIQGKYSWEFKNLENPDYGMWAFNEGPDSVGDWAARVATALEPYLNIVAFTLDNELDWPLESPEVPETQEYTADGVQAYFEFLKGIISQRISVPIITPLQSVLSRTDIKTACLQSTDLPFFTCYSPTAEQLNHLFEDELLPWLGSGGFKTNGWWVGEFNSDSWGPYVPGFTKQLLEVPFEYGASIVCLFTCNYNDDQDYAFFDATGDPVPKLVEIAAEFERLQAPMIESLIEVAATTHSDVTNKTIKSNKLSNILDKPGSESPDERTVTKNNDVANTTIKLNGLSSILDKPPYNFN